MEAFGIASGAPVAAGGISKAAGATVETAEVDDDLYLLFKPSRNSNLGL